VTNEHQAIAGLTKLSKAATQPQHREPPDCKLCGRKPHPDSYGHSYVPREQPPATDDKCEYRVNAGDGVIGISEAEKETLMDAVM